MEKLNIEFVYAACTLFCAVVGAVYDVITHKIPNAFTLPAMVFALLLHFAFGGWRQLVASAAGGLCCGTIFLAPNFVQSSQLLIVSKRGSSPQRR